MGDKGKAGGPERKQGGNIMRNPFDVEDVSSYRYPIVKLITSAIIVVAACNRTSIFERLDVKAGPVVNILFAIVGVAAIRCIYTGIAEIAIYHEESHKRHSGKKKKPTHLYSVEALGKMIEENDIIEIVVQYGEQQIEIGASAESDRSSGEFYNKEYYIEDQGFGSFREFDQKLAGMFPNGTQIPVVTIDGIAPESR